MSVAQERAESLYEETRQELARADDKANLLLAVNGLLVAALLAALLAGDFDPRSLDNRIEWLLWIGLASSLLAEVLLCCAVFPQVRHAARRAPPRYFGDIKDINADALKAALGADEDPYERVVDQLIVLAPTATTKYRLIAGGQVSLAAGVLACTVAAIVNVLL